MKFHLSELAIDLLPDTSKGEACSLELTHLNEIHHDVALANEAHKKQIKVKYDRNVKPCIFLEEDLVLLYDQEADKIGAGKFEPMWMGPLLSSVFWEKVPTS